MRPGKSISPEAAKMLARFAPFMDSLAEAWPDSIGFSDQDPAVGELLRETSAILEGHFILSSGRHSGRYVQCAKLLEHPRHAQTVGEALASLVVNAVKGQSGRFQDPGLAATAGHAPGAALQEPGAAFGIDLVAGPALGGILIAHEVARALGVRCVFAERTEGALAFRRGFAIAPGERVLVVEDVVTTGGSARETAALVERLGGTVVAFGAIIDRSDAIEVARMPGSQLPLHALLRLHVDTYEPAACPLCASGSEATKPGSRR